MNAIETLKEIKKVAKQNQNRDEVRKVKRVKDLKVGECYRQGDIYVFKVADDYPVGKEVQRNQIADGVSLGARHNLVGEFTIYEGKKLPEFIDENHQICLGYCFDILKEGAINTHPEHDNFIFEQTGRFQVIHQIDMRTKRRVMD